MNYKRNSTLLAMCLTALFVSNAVSVMAQGPDCPPSTYMIAGEKPTTPPDETDDGTEVATWDELALWMSEHGNSGGTVRLSAPIVCDDKYASFLFMSATTLDLGEHSLTVTGSLDLYSPHLTIKANGGADASLRVSSGGYLCITAKAVEHGTGGPAIWQDEGGILLSEFPQVDGAVHYAEQPVASATHTSTITVGKDEDVFDILPDTAYADVVFQGVTVRNKQMPVTWDISGIDVVEDLANRQRTTISGSFDDALTYGNVNCTVAFINQPITFTDVVAKSVGMATIINADFTCPLSPVAVALEYSFDGEHWSYIDGEISEYGNSPSFTAFFFEPDIAEDGDAVWDRSQHQTLYLQFTWFDAENTEDTYSDILIIDADTLGIGSKPGGNRGGGTGLLPPIVPPTDGDDTDGSDDTNTGDGSDTGTDADAGTDIEDNVDAGNDSNIGNDVGDDTNIKDNVVNTPPDVPKPPYENLTPEPEQSLPPIDIPTESTPPTKAIPPAVPLQGEQPAPIAELPISPPDTAGDLSTKKPTDAPERVYAPIPDEFQAHAELEPIHEPEPFTAPNEEVHAMTERGDDSTYVYADSYTAKTLVRAAVGVASTVAVITLTMTWGHWGKRLLSLLRRLLANIKL